MVKDKPDALILTGDLSFNGEKASHEELAAKLNKGWKRGCRCTCCPATTT